MLAHDDEFLYIAVRCRQAPGAHEDAGLGRHVHNADLSAHDRVNMLIDLAVATEGELELATVVIG